MLGLPSILLLVCHELNKCNYTGARLLDSFYHMTLTLLKHRISSGTKYAIGYILGYVTTKKQNEQCHSSCINDWVNV